MGRDLQKKKNRSGKQGIKIKPRKKRILNPLGNSIIAKNCPHRRFRDLPRAGYPPPRSRPRHHLEPRSAPRHRRRHSQGQSPEPLAISTIEGAVISETRVERDATGRIIRVIGSTTKPNPLRDQLNQFDEDEEEEEDEDEEEDEEDEEEWGGIDEGVPASTGIVRQLEELAAQPVIKSLDTKVRGNESGSRG
ncbi:unnamed protein product [Parascedosporium putredinis]|uniref:Uncharacterized protein n=1 Tax=Parascedosporium putredinis TaxID=1442378 RepID=A0A9P1H1E8_9PEZI|nr:unnamed protein product [Parascedosporium putredinis]CAI7993012.1 unnamed protein product [Parascedosporium putredinis]